MSEVRIIVVMITVFLAVTLLVQAGFSVPRDWIEGYRACRGDERREILEALRDYGKLLEALMNYKMFLLAGKIPAPLVVEKARLVKREDGVLVVKKETEIVPPDRIDLTVLEQLRVDLSKEMTYESGYWLFMDITGVPDYEAAYYRYLGKKKGLDPFVLDGKLVFGVYKKESEAVNDKVMLERSGVPELNIVYVESEEDLSWGDEF